MLVKTVKLEWDCESDFSYTNDSNKGMSKQKAHGTLFILHFIILV